MISCDRIYDSITSDKSFLESNTKIAFISSRGGTYADIFIMNHDGSNPINLTHDMGIVSDICFTPDGKQIVFDVILMTLLKYIR